MKVKLNKVRGIWILVLNLVQKISWKMNRNFGIHNRAFLNLAIKQVYFHLEVQSEHNLVSHLVLEVLVRVNMGMGLYGRQDSQFREENLEELIEIMIVLLLVKVSVPLLNLWTEEWCLYKLMKTLLLNLVD